MTATKRPPRDRPAPTLRARRQSTRGGAQPRWTRRCRQRGKVRRRARMRAPETCFIRRKEVLPVQVPLQLTFRGMAHSDALAAQVRLRAEKIDHLFDRTVS